MGYKIKKTRGMTNLVKWLTYHNLLRLRALMVMIAMRIEFKWDWVGLVVSLLRFELNLNLILWSKLYLCMHSWYITQEIVYANFLGQVIIDEVHNLKDAGAALSSNTLTTFNSLYFKIRNKHWWLAPITSWVWYYKP